MSTSTAAAVFCASAVLAASPANAAVAMQYEVVFIGLSVPILTESVQVELNPGDYHCVRGVERRKEDYHTGLIKSVPRGSVPGSPATRISIRLYRTADCPLPTSEPRYYVTPEERTPGVHYWRIGLS